MMRSMFAGVSGLRSHQVMMDVVGNNISNVNTVGFKASRVIFADALSQLIRGSSGGSGEATAGVNPQQVGLGVKVASTDLLMNQGGAQLTGKATDVAIQGAGFFITRVGGETLYTRAGSFSFDQDGSLVDPNGAIVQGWLADPGGLISTNAPPSDIQIPTNQTIPPVATTSLTIDGNISADATATDPPVITAIDVHDDLGTSQRITFHFTKTADNEWDMEAFDPDGTTMGTVPITFDPASGKLATPATPPSFTFSPTSGAADVTFDVDLRGAGGTSGVTQYGGASDAAATSQTGASAGHLRAFGIADDGVLSAVFSNGRTKALARLSMAKFANPAGLLKSGNNQFRPTTTSGQALVGISGTAGRGTFASGTLEMSNVELAQEFTNLIVAQRGFQANSRIITTSDELLQDLVNLKR